MILHANSNVWVLSNAQVFLLPDKTKATSTFRDEVHFEGEWVETHSGEQLLMEKMAKDQTSWLSSQPPGTFEILEKLTKFLWMELFRRAPDCSIRYSQYTLSKMESNSLLPTVFSLENSVLSTCELLSLSNKKLKTLGLTWVQLKS